MVVELLELLEEADLASRTPRLLRGSRTPRLDPGPQPDQDSRTPRLLTGEAFGSKPTSVASSSRTGVAVSSMHEKTVISA